jgi:alpha-galactosidase
MCAANHSLGGATEFPNLQRAPDLVCLVSADGLRTCQPSAAGWTADDVLCTTTVTGEAVAVTLQAETTPLARVVLRWNAPLTGAWRFLGDHWERGYGDLEWRGLVPERIMPWYFLATDGRRTHGCGVRTQPAAICWWTVDAGGISLWLDVRNGGGGVELRGRQLPVAEIVSRLGQDGESPFAAARAFCRHLCAAPRLPDHVVYGSNNWYYAYGVSSHAAILEDTRLLMELAPAAVNRPYMVIDAGWQARANDAGVEKACGAPWDRGNALFPDMPGLAAGMRALGARPGIWVRPLAAEPETAASRLLPVERAIDDSAKIAVLDPSLPENVEQIRADVRRAHDWGYALIKHDWTACDILGRWGFQFGHALTNDGWHFQDRTRTTAEIVLALYRAIRDGAGSSIVIGCNTFSHLSAGLFELQRTGDDTSGHQWERTRKMGVNTLAFRMAQHNAFYAVDADCVGLTTQVPWALNRQWLDLLAHSGTPTFVSAAPEALGPEQRVALKAAFAAAAVARPVAEPLDWLESTCPTRWRIDGEAVEYDWADDRGVNPLELQTL